MAARCARDTADSCGVRLGHMSVMEHHFWRPSRRSTIPLMIALGTALILVAACGDGGEAADEWQFRKIGPSDQVFTFDDLAATGFKKQKEYSVEGLAEATGAWSGWWRPGGGDLIDYQVRFYRSHDDAIEYGTSFAEEASGEDAIINSNDAIWKEDVRDRRVIHDTGESSGGYGAVPKYRDYAIFANMVLLCEGSTSEHSLDRCRLLIEALIATDVE